jgi:hypothetical protein
MGRLEAFEDELSRLHLRRPGGISLHLRSAEMVVRGLESFTRDQPPLSKNLRLPEFEQSDRLLFPKPRPRDMSAFAPVAFDARHSSDWAPSQ